MALVGPMKYLTIGDSTYEIVSESGSGGTVTSVAVGNATNGGLSVSGSPITSSGTITIGHSNVLTNAQTTQAVYPIKIDKNGHISAYGNAVTIPTVNNATLTIQKNGTTVNSFTANASSNVTANITVPTKVSELTNDSGYITNAGVTGVKGNSESSYRTGQVNLTAANIGAIPSNSNGNTQNLLRPLQLNGLADVTLDAKINTLRANRLAFLPADQIIIEKTTDGGSTWTDAGVADSTKVGLFSETRAGVSIPLLNGVKNINCGLRITITGMKYNVPSGTAETSKYNYWNSNYIVSTERYNQLKEMYFWVSANSDTISVKVERATGAASTTWNTIFDNSSYGMTGWSGNDYIRFAQGVFGGGTNQTSNYWNYRLTFFTRGPGGSTTLSGTNTTSAQSIQEIRGYGDTWWTAGNEYAANDKIYTHDYLKNVTFPANVTASGGFSGNVTGTATGNLTSVQYDSTNAKLTYTKNGSNTDIITVTTLKSALGSMTPASHSHGNITNAGDITTTAEIANGDRLIINDESASKVTNSSITFGVSSTKYLSNAGTWVELPTTTNSGTTGISVSDHSTSTIYGVQSSTTTASKVTLGTALSVTGVSGSTTASKVTVGSHSTDYGVTAAGSGSFTSGAFSGGSGSFSATVTGHVLSFSHSHTAATHGADSHSHTAPTLGSKVPTVSASDVTVPKAATSATSIPNVTAATDVTVPIKNSSSTTVVTGKTHTITDTGHTHALS